MRVGIIAPTFADARDVCVEGESGLLRILPTSCIAAWHRSTGDLLLFNGSRVKLFSADQPERLRGPQHHRVWCDELGAWPSRAAFDQLWFGLRLGADPRVVITTTPRNTDLIRELLEREDVWVTRGKTMDNAAHLAPRVLEQLTERYAGTRLGRQELDAELLTDTEGALWQRDLLERCRVEKVPELRRIVVAIDPAMSNNAGSDETGIVAAGRGVDGLIYVLTDWSGRYSPEGWAERAVRLYQDMRAQMIVAEVNAGGDLVERILRQVAPQVLFKPVRALRGKAERALPVAALYEQGKVKHVGVLGMLEDQMCRFAPTKLTRWAADPVAFYEDTVIPRVNRVNAAFEHWLTPMFGGGLELDYDLDAVSALTMRRDALYGQLQNVDFLTVNEKREALGYGAVEGGDSLGGGIGGKGRRGNGGGAREAWVKYNENHDPENGQFTSGDGDGASAPATPVPTDAITPVYPVETVLTSLLGGQAVAIARSVLGLAQGSLVSPVEETGLTDHGAQRLGERDIASQQIQEAIQTAMQEGNVTTQMGKYGTPQNVYTGSNGVTAIVETAGRNAGKLITAYYH